MSDSCVLVTGKVGTRTGDVEVIWTLESGLGSVSRENTHIFLVNHKVLGNVLSINRDPGEVGKAGRGERTFSCYVRRKNKDNQKPSVMARF